LAYWDHFSYLSAHYAWVQAVFYCTIVGGVFLEIARVLEPPVNIEDKNNPKYPKWSWHIRHPLSEILDWVMIIVVVLVTMFVWLSAIIVALFTEIAKVSQDWGALSAIIVYSILALILGITPLAPGTVADAVGGFLLVQILMHDSEGYTFYEAITFALALVTILHFVGSCLQYFIGKLKSVQQWANFALPADILAASDSVLLDANCFMVGIVGQVFMDTFNGLNQGRMDMNFFTQFWSEYASIPTAFCWVATGAVVSVQGQSGYDWADDAIPICLLMAATWQFIGTTVGGWALLKASRNETFWKNKEKWETVQHFAKLGVKATKDGWTNDCFCLATTNCLAKTVDIGSDTTLFEVINPIHKTYIDNIAVCDSVEASKVAQKKYNIQRCNARKDHWKILEEEYFAKGHDGIMEVKSHYKNLFIAAQPVEDETDRNAWRQRVFRCGCRCGCTYQMFLVIVALLSGIYSYLSVAQNIDTELAVQEGIDVLKDVSLNAWAGFLVFNLAVLIYYWRVCWDSLISGFCTLTSMFCNCCASSKNQDLETVFKPTWNSYKKAKYCENDVELLKSGTLNEKQARDLAKAYLPRNFSHTLSYPNVNDGRFQNQRVDVNFIVIE